MKKIYLTKRRVIQSNQMTKTYFTVFLMFIFCLSGFAQKYKKPHNLGSLDSFIESKMENKNEEQLTISVSDSESFVIDIKSTQSSRYKHYVFGTLRGFENATFYVLGDDEGLKGKLLDYKNKKAFFEKIITSVSRSSWI